MTVEELERRLQDLDSGRDGLGLFLVVENGTLTGK